MRPSLRGERIIRAFQPDFPPEESLKPPPVVLFWRKTLPIYCLAAVRPHDLAGKARRVAFFALSGLTASYPRV